MSHGRLIFDPSCKETPESNRVTFPFRNDSDSGKGKCLYSVALNLFLCEEAFPIPPLMSSKHDKIFFL